MLEGGELLAAWICCLLLVALQADGLKLRALAVDRVATVAVEILGMLAAMHLPRYSLMTAAAVTRGGPLVRRRPVRVVAELTSCEVPVDT